MPQSEIFDIAQHIVNELFQLFLILVMAAWKVRYDQIRQYLLQSYCIEFLLSLKVYNYSNNNFLFLYILSAISETYWLRINYSDLIIAEVRAIIAFWSFSLSPLVLRVIRESICWNLS